MAAACIAREKAIYNATEAKPGGWRGMRDFVVSSKNMVSDEVVQIFGYWPPSRTS